ncbi:S1/P1 nuclease-domain-containing protein [Crassisporium funariophilum]|nr:S1/P1 nuclease-domain-containing protein [Crassisporium funariophilum]
MRETIRRPHALSQSLGIAATASAFSLPLLTTPHAWWRRLCQMRSVKKRSSSWIMLVKSTILKMVYTQLRGHLQFIGDIGQPLHAEAFEKGGNGVNITCGGNSTNLHSLWDTGMITKLLAADYGSSVANWTNSLVARIQSGDFKSSAASWISCSPTTSPVKRSIEDDIAKILNRRDMTPLACPLVWAQDANTFDCSFVFDFSASQDLCNSSYFTGAVPIIETQIAKQGYRLAAWLNVLFDGATNLP